MSEAPIELIVAAFQDEHGAEEALKELKAAKKEHLIKIDDAAVIRKDAKGKVHIKETADMGGGKGAAIGGVVGAAIGILTGGVGLVLAGAGALVGGLAAKLRDSGFDDNRLKTVGDSLKPGSSAIVAVIEHKWVQELEQELEEQGADVLTAAISADIAEQLAAGHDVAYSALSTEEGLTTGRVAAGEDEVQVSSTTFTEDAVERVDAVVNEAGAAARHIVATDEGVAVEGAVVTDDAAAYGAGVATEAGAVAAGFVEELKGEGADETPAVAAPAEEEQEAADS